MEIDQDYSMKIVRLLDETKAKYFILENVVGLLSSNSGADMGAVIGALVERGYGVAYRILDAQHFGVPQRRRRVFIVGCARDSGRTPAQILALTESSIGHFKKGTKSRENTAFATPISLTENGKSRKVVNTLSAELYHKNSVVNQDLANGHLVIFDPHHSDGVRIQGKTINTLTAKMGTGGNNVPMLAYPMHGAMVGRKETAGPNGSGFLSENDPSYTLTASNQSRHGAAIITENTAIVRRLTPIECERLQGFPDNWTQGQADQHRYKQMGNAVAVPVVEFIVKRLVGAANECN